MWLVSPRVNALLTVLCGLLAAEAIGMSPLNADAGSHLRTARALADGAIPCRDVRCSYTPLASAILSLAHGRPVPSLLLVQAAILGCALLTYRLARVLGHEVGVAVTSLNLTWVLLLANDGRAIVIEPFTVFWLLLAANSFAESREHGGALRSGLWISMGFWTKQYALLGWAGLLATCAWERRLGTALRVSAGVLFGLALGVIALLGLGLESGSLAGLFQASAYPNHPIWQNLMGAPELLGVLGLTIGMTWAGGLSRENPGIRLLVTMSVSALSPLVFRGYRHYWHFGIPFLVLLFLGSLRAHDRKGLTALARGGAAFLIVLSVGLDVGRCVRDVLGQARASQRARAEVMAALGRSSARTLYLVEPALLAWMEAPILAPKQVGPRTDLFSRSDGEALMKVADTVVWDTSALGADAPLRGLSPDVASELRRRGFAISRTAGSVQVYSRVP